MTILAQNVHEKILILLWHWRSADFIIKVIPKLFHIQHRLLTGRTSVMSRRQKLLEACTMQQMTTDRDMTRDAAGMDILETHSTIRSANVFNAPVTIDLKLNGQTHIARRAVKKSIFPTHSTNSTRITVILRLIVIIEKIANQACVFSKSNSTALTIA